MRYIIIVEVTPAELQRKVNAALTGGYTPQGGVSVGPSDLPTGIGVVYAQAMVKNVDNA